MKSATRIRVLAIAAATASGLASFADAPLLSHAGTIKPPPAPVASTGYAGQLTYTSAVLHGSVYPGVQPATWYFQYGPTSAYGSQTSQQSVPAAGKSLAVSAAVGDLEPGATYHYRLVAVGPGGTSPGSDQLFSTRKIPLSLSAIVSKPNPVVFGSGVTVSGTLSGTGNAGVQVVLQENPFPYKGFQAVGTPQATGADGSFAFRLPSLPANTRLRVKTVARPILTSDVALEEVAVTVTFHVRATSRRGYALLYGTIAPAKPGARVAFELLRKGHRYVVVAGAKARWSKHKMSFSRFSALVRIRHAGLYRALVVVRPGGAQVAGRSRQLRIR